MYKVIYTKSLNSDLKKILGQGQKKVVQAVRAAMAEASGNGEIVSLPRTKHGESRIPHVEKYDLPDACRLVVQLVDGVQKTRAFLFVGNHDDAEHWLDTHKNYKWVRSSSDGVLDFVLVTGEAPARYIPADRLDLISPDEIRLRPLLHSLSDEDWVFVDVPAGAKEAVQLISGEKFEQDAEGIFEQLDRLVGYDKASLLFDLMWHAHTQEWQELSRRLEIRSGRSTVVADSVAGTLMANSENSESFITFDDNGLLDEFLSKNTIADWMLFLHPEQKNIADRDLKGAARLRGVSGSGKTCVLVHRARYLAKKYKQPVLLVTLTDSMRRLLDRLADDLCGAERSLIETKTMSMFAKDTLHDLSPGKSNGMQFLLAERHSELVSGAAQFLQKRLDGISSAFKGMTFSELSGFLHDEFSYVRGRLVLSDLERYVDAKLFQRKGRGVALNQSDRRLVLDALRHYLDEMIAGRLQDHEGFVSSAIDILDKNSGVRGKFRCVLSDEVQDLSELDVALLGKLKSPAGEPISQVENGLFLAGDGAQSIYKRGFALRRLGIDIVGRSFSLKKNYRNTHEILKAAFGLVSQYEFADVDEENIARPATPDFAMRYGAKPLLLRCNGLLEEAGAIAGKIRSSVTMGLTPGQICVIAPNAKLREEMKRALDHVGVPSVELRLDVDYESDRVKISTIESAKGHEFSAVFIMGLVEGVLPAGGVGEHDLPREAARLYVAMTRARESVAITYSPSPGYPVSRFLTAIQQDCDEAFMRNGELRKVA